MFGVFSIARQHTRYHNIQGTLTIQWRSVSIFAFKAGVASRVVIAEQSWYLLIYYISRLPGACRVYQGEVHCAWLLWWPLQPAGGDGERCHSLHPAGALLFPRCFQDLRRPRDPAVSRSLYRGSDDGSGFRPGNAGQEPGVPVEAVPGLCVSKVTPVLSLSITSLLPSGPAGRTVLATSSRWRRSRDVLMVLAGLGRTIIIPAGTETGGRARSDLLVFFLVKNKARVRLIVHCRLWRHQRHLDRLWKRSAASAERGDSWRSFPPGAPGAPPASGASGAEDRGGRAGTGPDWQAAASARGRWWLGDTTEAVAAGYQHRHQVLRGHLR